MAHKDTPLVLLGNGRVLNEDDLDLTPAEAARMVLAGLVMLALLLTVVLLVSVAL